MIVAASTVAVVAIVIAIVAIAAALMYVLPRGRRWRRPSYSLATALCQQFRKALLLGGCVSKDRSTSHS